jgi:transposase
MSATELDRLTVIERVRDRRLSQVDAAEQLGLTPRHISRLVNAFERDGPAALVSKRRGRRSNHAWADAVKTRVLSLVREHYVDFGPTLIAEKLAEKHELELSRETLRLWLMEAGLWQSSAKQAATGAKADRPPAAATRRDCPWTTRAYGAAFRRFGDVLRLLPRDSPLPGALRQPVAFYSDKQARGAVSVFGRAPGLRRHPLRHQTRRADGAAAGEEYRYAGGRQRLPAGLSWTGSTRSSPRRPPATKDLHRPLTELDDLDEVLSWQEERTVSNSLTVQYDRVVYLLEPNDVTVGLRRKKARIRDYPDGTIAVKYDGADLPYSVFDKARQVKQADIVSNKRLGAVLKHVQEQQQIQAVERSKKAPTRRGQRRSASERFREANPAVG